MKNVLLIALSSLFMLSCNNGTKTKDTANEQASSHNHDSTSQSNALKIALDGGTKWIVNEEMKPFVLAGEDLVKHYQSENNTDYKSLAEKLKLQNNGLIKSCTMSGKSHDELHKWLHPHLELVTKLEKAENEKDSNAIISQLLESYKTYHEYFQ
ncbi:hypothetical protein [Solitalea canadensis]|nr:hypothetical protein [Solitalea canadensis]